MNKWKTLLTLNGRSLGDIEIRRGIFQGDSLSPLLFVLSLAPLSALLNKQKIGYKLRNKQEINHLLFMDDIKLFGKTKKQITELINTVHMYSNDIGMEFGINKCGILEMNKGKLVNVEN